MDELQRRWFGDSVRGRMTSDGRRVFLVNDLDDLDLKPGAPVKKLDLVGGKAYSGNAAGKFVEAKLFDFAPLGGHFEAPKK